MVENKPVSLKKDLPQAQGKKLLEALYTVTAAVGKSLHLKEVLDAALDTVLEVMKMEAGSIQIVNENQELIPMIFRNLSEELVKELTHRKFGQGLSGNTAQSGKVVIASIDEDPRVTSEVSKKEKYRYYLGLPLFAKNQVVGILEIVDQKYRVFSDADLDLLHSIGHAVGIAIENAKLYEQSKMQSERLTKTISLLENDSFIFTTFNSNLSLLLQSIFKVAETLLKTPYLTIALSEPDNKKIYWHYYNAEINTNIKPPALFYEMVKNGWGNNNILINKQACTLEFPPNQIELNVVSTVTIPLFFKERGGHGALLAFHEEDNYYTNEDHILLKIFANQATIAIENWWLYRREAKMVTELQNLNYSLEHLVNIHNQLTQLVLEESGFKAMAKRLSKLVDNPVIIQDRFWNIVTCSCCSENHATVEHLLNADKVETIKANNKIDKEAKIFISKRRVSRLEADPDCGISEPLIIVPIVIGLEVIGYITAIERDKELKKSDQIAIEHSAAILALEFMKQHIAFETESKLKRDFIDDLFSGDKYSEAELAERAKFLGFDLGSIKRMMIFQIYNVKQKEREDDVLKREYFDNYIMNEIKNIVSWKYAGSLVVRKEKNIFILIAGGKQLAIDTDPIKQLGNNLLQFICQYLDHTSINAIIGNYANNVDETRESYTNLLHCLDFMAFCKATQQVMFMHDLGLIGLLLTLKDKKLLMNYSNQILQPIIFHDLKHNMNLLETLSCYLEHNCNAKDAADVLFIHVNTLRYRIKRIEELLHIDLNTYKDRINVFIALYIMKMLTEIKPGNTWVDACKDIGFEN